MRSGTCVLQPRATQARWMDHSGSPPDEHQSAVLATSVPKERSRRTAGTDCCCMVPWLPLGGYSIDAESALGERTRSVQHKYRGQAERARQGSMTSWSNMSRGVCAGWVAPKVTDMTKHLSRSTAEHGARMRTQETGGRKENASFDPGGSISEVHGRQIWDTSPTERKPEELRPSVLRRPREFRVDPK